ncbi:helix-turn-helix domain-containing protein [Flavobacterium rhizosphaerae]|uniref:Helix-turn-helix domain-containing protein n=1 Tax=Flavobacterium rhizosphaerae TaxID=3163298 RepID=A0ABW8YUU0_9FLAO
MAKHIAYYYFHWSDSEHFHRIFTFYPNYNHALTVYKNSDVELFEASSKVSTSQKESLTVLYSVNTHHSAKVDLSGPFNKIGIVFNPAGINHFLKKPLGTYTFNPPFDYFDHFGNMLHKVLGQVYAEQDAEKKGEMLDVFFESIYNGFEEPIAKAALMQVLNSNGTVKVEELSEKTGINRKTLLRLFKKHFCASVEEYKKMVMFRNALNYSQQHDDASLTDVALYNLYYDQAHFIKHFKSVTRQSPKTLLHHLTHLGGQEALYWHFEE